MGGIGLLRFPDFYARCHAAGMTDTLGSILLIAGLMLQTGFELNLARLTLILLFPPVYEPGRRTRHCARRL